MDFNKEFSDFKNRESEQLAKFGEGARIYRILGEIEMKRSFAKYFYEAGQQSKQAEIDALQKKIDKIREVVEEQYGEIDYWADVAFDHVIEELDK